MKQAGIECCVVITTCSSDEEADKIARVLLDARLAACVQVTDIRSHYVWKGERTAEPEKLLLIKIPTDHYPQVEAAIVAAHSYEVPEVICIPVVAGSPAYLEWINEVTGAASSEAE